MLRHLMRTLGVAVGFAILVGGAQTALAEDTWPVGISCEVEDLEGGGVTEFSKVSIGPWVIAERTISRAGALYSLRMEGSAKHSWVVIYLKNLQSGASQAKYDAVSTQEKLLLEFEGWNVECRQWPYIAG